MTPTWPIDDEGRSITPNLVAGIYRLAKREGQPLSAQRGEERLTQTMQRLVTQYGRAEIIRRIRAAQVREDQKLYQGWLVLTAEACKDPSERHRAGTF